LLISIRLYLHDRGLMPKETEAGVAFWGSMYIPVVVAMAAQQNVVAALRGGPVAVIAAVLAVLASGCCIALLSRTGDHEPLPPLPAETAART
jgi:malonate transporter MadL subunit